MNVRLTPLVLTAILSGGTLHAQGTSTLEELRDHKRVLLVFAGSNDPRVEQQWNALVDQCDQAAEREVVTVLLTRSLVRKHNGNHPPQVDFSQNEEQALRRRFHVPQDQFTVLLVGKDGGEKLRGPQPITWQTLQTTIDAMPMRQAEMHHSR